MGTKQSTFSALYSVLKNELRAKGLSYRDIATELGATQSSVKQRFANRSLTIEQLIAIAEVLGLTLSELTKKTEAPSIEQFTLEQEQAFVRDLRLIVVLNCVLDGLALADIVDTYDITEAQCIKYLLELDRFGLIELLPDNRVRLRIQRGLEWQPGGPLHRLVASRIGKFFDNRFDGPFEYCFISRASLTPAASAVLREELRQLKRRVELLHRECEIAPADQRRDIVMVTAAREWQLPDFEALRRDRSKAAK